MEESLHLWALLSDDLKIFAVLYMPSFWLSKLNYFKVKLNFKLLSGDRGVLSCTVGWQELVSGTRMIMNILIPCEGHKLSGEVL